MLVLSQMTALRCGCRPDSETDRGNACELYLVLMVFLHVVCYIHLRLCGRETFSIRDSGSEKSCLVSSLQ